MKKLLLATGIFLLALVAKAQNQGDVGINLYGGYTFDDKISDNSYALKFKGAFQYGVGAEFYIRPSKSIELKYLRMDSDAVFTQYLVGADKVTNGNVGINYILIGGNNYFQTGNPSVKPFLGLDLGVGWLNSQTGSHTGFAWDFKAGVKIKTSDSTALKLQGYFQTIWASYGGDVVVYPGWGTYIYPENSSLYQFGLGAAFEFDFKH
jgi:Outer membrane protein beta-barrel domain